MMPFMTQPAESPACYVPRERDTAALLFNAAAGAHLTRTPAVAGNRRRSTQSLWVQRGRLPGELVRLWYVQITGGRNFSVYFDGSNRLVQQTDSGAEQNATSTAVFRDSGPIHVLSVIDTEQAEKTDRARLYVNGRRLSLSGAWCPQGADHDWNSTALHSIGRHVQGIQFLDGVVADFVNVDGLTLDPSVFGEFNIHGVWVPRPAAEIHAAVVAAGGWGINGCHLDFADPLNPGKDVSGKANHWAAVGFDATGKDTVVSSPTNVYATLNPLITDPYRTILESGLQVKATSTVGSGNAFGTIPMVRKSFFEATVETVGGHLHGIGLMADTAAVASGTLGAAPGAITYWQSGRVENAAGTLVFSGSGFVANMVVLVAYDPDTGSAWISRDGNWLKGNPATGLDPLVAGLSGRLLPRINGNALSGTAQTRLNFGQRPFVQTTLVAQLIAAGFNPLCTDNLPEPDIKDPAEALVQAVATGADMVAVLDAGCAHWNADRWVEIIKRREVAEDWRVRFSDDPANAWATNNTNAKAAASALAAAGNYVGYRLRVGARYGVWTGEVTHTTGTATTVTHGLNTARNVVIATRVSTGGGSRYLRHPDMDAGKLMVMGAASAGCISDASLGDFAANGFSIAAACPSGTYRVLVLAERPGLLCLTAYTGNGGVDGAFVPMDVLPHLAMIVETTASGGVRVWDGARSPGNPAELSCALTASAVENSSASVDFVVGGVKLRSTAATVNGSGVKYLGIAIGRPIGGVCVAPATAR